jgi:hypothetical protein
MLRGLESNDFCLICSEEVRVCDFEMSELLPPQIRRPSRVRMRLSGLPRQLRMDNQPVMIGVKNLNSSQPTVASTQSCVRL